MRLLVLLLFGTLAPILALAQASLSVTPAYVYITEREPHGFFALHNGGDTSIEVVLLARYGVIESDSAATFVTLGEAGSLGDLAARLTFFPDRIVLGPGNDQHVRFMVRGVEDVADGAHIALMNFEMQERAAVTADQIPAVASALSIVYSLVAPIVLIKGHGGAALEARIVQKSKGRVNLLLTNQSTFPFVGGVTIWSDGHMVGRAESAVYTRRTVEVEVVESIGSGPLQVRFDAAYPGVPNDVRSRLVLPAPIELAW